MEGLLKKPHFASKHVDVGSGYPPNISVFSQLGGTSKDVSQFGLSQFNSLRVIHDIPRAEARTDLGLFGVRQDFKTKRHPFLPSITVTAIFLWRFRQYNS
jgi:hypothetical protein